MPRFIPTRYPSTVSTGLLGSLALLLCLPLTASDAAAQRPFDIYDPFYRSETARQMFFDGYALTAEVYYRRTGDLQPSSIPVDGETSPQDYQSVPSVADPLGLSFFFDYQLASQLNFRAILDAASGPTGRRITLSWLSLKYHRHLENDDYALRLAVDPTPDGQAGFPQVDAALIYTSALSPLLTSDFAVGIRRVRLGYEDLVVASSDPASEAASIAGLDVLPRIALDGDGNASGSTSQRPVSIYRRAIGWELHAMLNYNIYLDPAGSNIFVSLFGDVSSYDLVEVHREQRGRTNGYAGDAARQEKSPTPISPWSSSSYHGGVIWFRSGLSFARPSYRAVPFLAVPLGQWLPAEDDWPKASVHAGLQLTLR